VCAVEQTRAELFLFLHAWKDERAVTVPGQAVTDFMPKGMSCHVTAVTLPTVTVTGVVTAFVTELSRVGKTEKQHEEAVVKVAMTRDERDAEIDKAAMKAWNALLDLLSIEDKYEAVERLRARLALEEKGWLPEAERNN
jgi:hypothetical protein